jgi:hypothetical protein
VALGFNDADFNTAVGTAALLLNTTGTENTGIGTAALASNEADQNTATGAFALSSHVSGNGNTAVGAGALASNIDGSRNTAVGAGALTDNQVSGLTAVGLDALSSNTTGLGNTAVGASALSNNMIGFSNTAVGSGALLNNDSTGSGLGINNTAVGAAALSSNTDGSANNAIGHDALGSNTTGRINQALGVNALRNNDSGDANVAIGTAALFNNVSGDDNTAVGQGTGSNIVAGSDNVYIGAGVQGPADESATTRIGDEAAVSACYVAGIIDSVVAGANVHINPATSQLSITASSARFKEDVKPMANASESLFALNPVTFRYKKNFDATGIPQFGLVAEEVAKVNRDLVLLDRDGKPYTVRYEEVNAMLLNEFLKQHKKVEAQQATIAELRSAVGQQQKNFESRLAQQEKQIEWLATTLQKVSAQLEMSRPAPQVVENHH